MRVLDPDRAPRSDDPRPAPPKAYTPDARGPLDGVRVLDLSRLVAGNMLTLQLADFGADVIKIEREGSGDDLRSWREQGQAIYWKVYGRNKRSLVLDIRSDAGRATLLKLVRHAQVLVENFVPGGLEKMGLGSAGAARGQPGAGDRARVGLGADRPVPREAGLRHAGGGDERLRVPERLRRPAAAAAAAGARRT
ncbi:MAG: CoA transferase [Comamonadaceae bacterium]|nr:CoA transferase [Comamonadaceae bacterium]